MPTVTIQQDLRSINNPVTSEKYLFVFDDIYKYTPDRMKYMFPGFAVTGRFNFIGSIKGILPATVTLNTTNDKVISLSPGLLQCNEYGIIIKEPISITLSDPEIDQYKSNNNLPNTFTAYMCAETNIVACDAPTMSTTLNWILATYAERVRFDITNTPNIRIPVLALDIDTTNTPYTVNINIVQTLEFYL